MSRYANFNDAEYWDSNAKEKAMMLSKATYRVRKDEDIPIVLRDRIRPYCDVYSPDINRDHKFPVLIGYSPFVKEAQAVGRKRDPIRLGDTMYGQGIEIGGIDFLDSRGYIVVIPNPRGILSSEGIWTRLSSEQDQKDCCHIIQWAGHYLSDGNVGMIGSGYAGQIQPLVASYSPKYLKAIMPIDVMDDMYLACCPGGILSDINYPLCSYISVINSVSEMELENTDEVLRKMLEETKSNLETAANSYYYRGLYTWPPRHYTWNIDILLNPLRNNFWEKRSFGKREIKIPTYLVSLYYEYGQNTISAFDIYNKISDTTTKKLMIIDSAIDKTSPYEKPNFELLRWYDHWLKDMETGIMDEPSMKLILTGKNIYKYDKKWASKTCSWTKFFLRKIVSYR